MSAEPQKKPITIITGFLGSGKTTVLNQLLQDKKFSDTAVIINEFGEIGIDHLLVETSFEEDEIVVMQSGCICCTIRGDLVDTLADLETRTGAGDLPYFNRVLVETTGLADPAPILQTIMSDPLLVGKYRLGGVVATVDAVNGAGTLDQHQEAVKQAAVADRLFVTKTDLADPGQTTELEARLGDLNPGAPLEKIIDGKVSPDNIFGLGLYDVRQKTDDVRAWLADTEVDTHRHHHAEDTHDDVNRHDSDIAAFCIVADEPLPWAGVRAWLESIGSLRGEDLLRVKGILNVAEFETPVIIHGVQHVFHPPIRLDVWPDDDHTTRIVFITKNIPKAGLEKSLESFCQAAGKNS
ncbi:GTP-binding protein [Alphaproteobacteria bacterium]|jgi:G3E family GTPase|nr:GTP-binding protein [Alphaproteobacteria bacterium]